MVLKFFVPIVLGAALVSGATAMAPDYRPDEFLTLDLPKALLSPKRLGPEAHFESMPVEAKADQKADQATDQVTNEAMTNEAVTNQQQTTGKAVATTRPEASAAVPRSIAHPRVRVARPFEKPHGRARAKLAHGRGNPLDAQAMDTRIQTWPCKPGSGGICNWR